MRTISKTAAAALALATTLAGCSGLSAQEKRTAVGAGVGAVAGHVITGGPIGTVGGAVVGGAVGHEWERIKK